MARDKEGERVWWFVRLLVPYCLIGFVSLSSSSKRDLWGSKLCWRANVCQRCRSPERSQTVPKARGHDARMISCMMSVTAFRARVTVEALESEY